ncbi:MAG: hypothetical protein A3F69_03770 [Acidobacteria bacterium RIFCSPLOWO2_12_FULL_66_10]|nr:MAG: hypothetical protein A3F69_03770 [Acidobacteria bacterium RIFCSPLOWO2_12_FULL_66_10]
MPRIADIPGPYWLFFYSFDCHEPIHVHVRRENKACKFWVVPVELTANHGFTPRELNEIRRLIQEYQHSIIEAWNEHCSQYRAPN